MKFISSQPLIALRPVAAALLIPAGRVQARHHKPKCGDAGRRADDRRRHARAGRRNAGHARQLDGTEHLRPGSAFRRARQHERHAVDAA